MVQLGISLRHLLELQKKIVIMTVTISGCSVIVVDDGPDHYKIYHDRKYEYNGE